MVEPTLPAPMMVILFVIIPSPIFRIVGVTIDVSDPDQDIVGNSFFRKKRIGQRWV